MTLFSDLTGLLDPAHALARRGLDRHAWDWAEKKGLRHGFTRGLRPGTEVARDAMRAIKAALDPEGRMDPGKVIPAAASDKLASEKTARKKTGDEKTSYEKKGGDAS